MTFAWVSRRAAGLLLLLATAACSVREPTSDSASGDRGSRDLGPGGDAGLVSCQLALGTAVGLDDAEAEPGGQFYASGAWRGSGVVSLWQKKGGQGLRLALLDANAALVGPIQTIWGNQSGPQQSQIAVNGDVVALASTGSEGASNPRMTCELGLVQLLGTSIKTPFRVSDAPSGATVLNEVGTCSVSAADGGFLVVWSQIVDDKTLLWRMFAQRFDLQGNAVGGRFKTSASTSKGVNLGGSLAFDGKRAFIAHLDHLDQPTLTTIVGDQLTSAPLSQVGVPPFVRPDIQWVGTLLLRWGDKLAEIDGDGKVLAGPVTLPPVASVGRVAGALVVIYKDEFLAAQGLDAKLQAQGKPVGLSQDRNASLQRLVSAPDGSAAVALFFDPGFRAVALRCNATPSPPLGPGTCPEKSSVSPLDDGCVDDVCHAVIRLDYKTLGLKGYAIVGAPYQPVDEAAAKLKAEAVFKQYGKYLPEPLNPQLGPVQAGLYHAVVPAGDFGGYCLIGAESGVAVTAGGIVWAGLGQWWLPASWKSVDALSCGPTPVTAQQVQSTTATCSGDTTPGSKYTASDALKLTLRLNLTAHYAGRGAFSAYAMLYTPSIGHCDPGVAEFVVVLSQRRK